MNDRRPGRMLVLTLAVALLITSNAHAHGRSPEANGIAFGPDGSGRILLDTTRGLFITTDGGLNWRFVCRASMGVTDLEDPSFRWMGTETVVGATNNGVTVGDGSGCGWTLAGGDARDVPITAIATDRLEGRWAYATTGSTATSNRIISTPDSGASWSSDGPLLGPDPLRSVAAAPSLAQRIYVVGDGTESVSVPLHLSNDSGLTFAARLIPLLDGEVGARLLAIDPVDPDHLLVRITVDPARTDLPERVVRSTNGGSEWTTSLMMRSARAAAFSPDGRRVWIGARLPGVAEANDGGVASSSLHGLWRSDDGGATFVHVRSDLSIGCLAWHDGQVWLCGAGRSDGFDLARLDPEGNVVPFFEFADAVGPVECTDTTPGGDCAAEELDLLLDLGQTEWATGSGEAGAGCSCSAAPRRPSRRWLSWLAVLFVALMSTRARRGPDPYAFKGSRFR